MPTVHFEKFPKKHDNLKINLDLLAARDVINKNNSSRVFIKGSFLGDAGRNVIFNDQSSGYTDLIL